MALLAATVDDGAGVADNLQGQLPVPTGACRLRAKVPPGLSRDRAAFSSQRAGLGILDDLESASVRLGRLQPQFHRSPDREVEPRFSAVDVSIGDDATSAGTSYHVHPLLTCVTGIARFERLKCFVDHGGESRDFVIFHPIKLTPPLGSREISTILTNKIDEQIK